MCEKEFEYSNEWIYVMEELLGLVGREAERILYEMECIEIENGLL